MLSIYFDIYASKIVYSCLHSHSFLLLTGPKGDLRGYLERLAMADNVQEFVSRNEFGQRPIRPANPSWGYYLNVIKSVQENDIPSAPDGGANCLMKEVGWKPLRRLLMHAVRTLECTCLCYKHITYILGHRYGAKYFLVFQKWYLSRRIDSWKHLKFQTDGWYNINAIPNRVFRPTEDLIGSLKIATPCVKLLWNLTLLVGFLLHTLRSKSVFASKELYTSGLILLLQLTAYQAYTNILWPHACPKQLKWQYKLYCDSVRYLECYAV